MVSGVEDPAEASFFESFEAAHSSHDLSNTIARVWGLPCLPLSWTWVDFDFCRNLESKRLRSELIARPSMGHWRGATGPYIFDFLEKGIARRYGIMLQDRLSSPVTSLSLSPQFFSPLLAHSI